MNREAMEAALWNRAPAHHKRETNGVREIGFKGWDGPAIDCWTPVTKLSLGDLTLLFC